MSVTVQRTGVPDDPPAFGEWLRPHLVAISNLIARLAPAADRDDAVQEVLLRAWSKRHTFDPDRGSPLTWLLAIAADQAAKARRRVRRHEPLPDRAAAAVLPNLDVERALRRLTRRQRIAVECVYFVGLSIAETAAVMGCADGTVKSTLADARAKLRPLLEVTS